MGTRKTKKATKKKTTTKKKATKKRASGTRGAGALRDAKIDGDSGVGIFYVNPRFHVHM